MASISTCFTISPNRSHLLFPYSLLSPPKPPPLPLSGPQTLHHRLSRVSWKPPDLRGRVPQPSVRARASIDVPGAIGRPGGAVETDKLPTDVRNRTMEAVDACGGRVTLGDVASRAGLKLNEAQRALQALASDTDGFLEVSDEGDVLYVFPKDYRAKLAAKSFRMKIEPLFDKGKAAADYLVRAAFGTALITSIVVVYTTIIVILSSKSDEDNRQRRGGRSFSSGANFYFNVTDLLWYWDPYYYKKQRAQADTDKKMSFIESVFSFVFGDGDPNEGIEEKRWKLIGQYIASNGGVVTAEELAPFLDVQNTKENMNDESYILPVLLRFNGEPEIDEEGNILYQFPSLQRTATSQRSGRREYVGRQQVNLVDGVDKFFRERKWKFSNADLSERGMVIGLGAANLFGVIFLGALLKEMAVAPSGFIKFVAGIFPLLQIYAGSFFAIPLVRWFFILMRNGDIEKRNQARKRFTQVLESPDLSLRRKLLSARDMAQRTVIGQDRILYSTDRDIIEQDVEAKEWTRRMKEIEKSD